MHSYNETFLINIDVKFISKRRRFGKIKQHSRVNQPSTRIKMTR